MEQMTNIDITVINVITDSEKYNQIIGNYINQKGQTKKVLLLVSNSRRFDIKENHVLHCVFNKISEPNFLLPTMNVTVTCLEVHKTPFPARLMAEFDLLEEVKIMTEDDLNQLDFPLD